MTQDANDKIDLSDAVLTGLLITSALAFGLGMVYAMAYFGLMGSGLLKQVPFPFVILSLIITFNLSFSFALVDQLWS